MSQVYSNNVDTTLADALSDSATTAILTDGAGLRSLGFGEFELLTIISLSGQEIVRVTARTGNSITIVRAQESTTAQAWTAGTRVFAGITAGTLSRLPQNSATGSGALSLGASSRALGSNANAYGRFAYADHNESLAVGYFAFADAVETVAIGRSAQALGARSTAIGRSANVYDADSVGIGRRNSVYGIQSVVIGHDGLVEGERAIGIGHECYAGADDSIAIGSLSSVNFGVAGGIAVGQTTVRANRTMQAAALPVVPRATGLEAEANWKMVGSASVLCTAALDLKTLQTYTITLPTGVTFFPEEVGVIITAAAGVTGQPSVRFGATADEARYLAATAMTATAAHGRDRWVSLASANGSDTLRFEVTAVATGTTLTGRAYFRGFAVVNAA